MKMLDILGIRIEGKKIGKMAEVIKVAESFGIKAKKPEEALEKLADMREEARKQKNYALSDEIRARLKTAGVIIEDKKDGIRWRIED
jgi:cysteinyl-tRNA synthetase